MEESPQIPIVIETLPSPPLPLAGQVLVGGLSTLLATTITYPIIHGSDIGAIVRTHPFLTLWTGNITQLKSVIPVRPIEIALREQLRGAFIPLHKQKEMPIWQQLSINTGIGGFVGITAHSIKQTYTYNYELWARKATFASLPETKPFTTKAEMLKALKMPTYKNFLTGSLPQATLQGAIYYGLYDTLQSAFVIPTNSDGTDYKSNFGANLLCGLAASSAASAVTSPILFARSVFGDSRPLLQVVREAFSKIGLANMYTHKETLTWLALGAVLMPTYDYLTYYFKQEREKKNNVGTFILDGVLGGTAAATTKYLASPVERAYLLQSLSKQMNRPEFNTFTGTMRYMAVEGSLTRGSVANISRYAPVQILNFSIKDLLARNIFCTNKNDFLGLQLLNNSAAGGVAGIVSSVLTYPFDISRTTIAQEMAKARSSNTPKPPLTSVEMMMQIYGKEGMSGLYRGFSASLLGVCLYRALYFGLYDTLKTTLPPSTPMLIPVQFLLAYSTTLVSGVIIWPIDTARRQVMLSQSKGITMTATQALRTVITRDGVTGLFKNAKSNLQRSVTGAGVLVIYDQLQSYVYSTKEAYQPIA